MPGYAAYLAGCSIFGAAPDRAAALVVCRITASILPMLAFLFFFHGWLSRETKFGTIREAVFVSVAIGSLLGSLSATHPATVTSASTDVATVRADIRTRRGRG